MAPERSTESSVSASIVLTRTEGSAEILPLPGGRFRVVLKPTDEGLFIPVCSCVTTLPLEVISAFFDRSFAWLCDWLARHDDPNYVVSVLRNQLFAYFDASAFAGRRLLDFGCGSGASTFGLAAMLPQTEVVGVDLSDWNIRLAETILEARRLPNCRFLLSPHGSQLPEGIGAFDFVMLSAVYEHLLPQERRVVLPLIWSVLNPGGALFINQTPYRYFPLEHHSTDLWLINYLPDRLAMFFASRFAKHNPEENRRRDWESHLRGGIRGGTEGEILRNLRSAKLGRPVVMRPRSGDRASYWLACTSPDRYRLIKKAVATLFRVTDWALGTIPSMNLDVVIRKDQA